MISGLQPDTQQYNRQQFTWLVQETDGFKRLDEAIGPERTGELVDLIFDSEVREGANGRYILLSPSEEDGYANGIGQVLDTESEQVSEKLAYVTTLLKSTMAGELRAHLDEMTEPEQYYCKPHKLPPEGTRQREIAKAAHWIAAPMHGDGQDKVQDILTRHVLDTPTGVALGKRPADILDVIHSEIVEHAPRVRGPNPGTAYPSSIGGRFLLEHIFEWTSRIIWPGPGEDVWRDVALFYLGAVMTVQGYVDGNKRTARMAYALTLLKAEMTFDAPNASLEAGLARMERPSEM